MPNRDGLSNKLRCGLFLVLRKLPLVDRLKDVVLLRNERSAGLNSEVRAGFINRCYLFQSLFLRDLNSYLLLGFGLGRLFLSFHRFDTELFLS